MPTSGEQDQNSVHPSREPHPRIEAKELLTDESIERLGLTAQMRPLDPCEHHEPVVMPLSLNVFR